MRGPLRTAIATCLTLVLAVPAASAHLRSGTVHRRSSIVGLTLDVAHPGRQIPRGFLGLGVEYDSLARYSGDDPNAVNPVLEQLIRNLTPGQTPILRIGGDTTDWSWWPVPGMNTPPGVSFAITPQWTAVTRALTQSLQAHLILGVNFEADSQQIAQTEARQLIHSLGQSSVAALELGNEPELYHSFGWYKDANGNEVPGRPANWGFPMFHREFTSIANSLPSAPMAGPTTGNPAWDPEFGSFLASERRVKIATVHRYPLWVCKTPSNPLYPSVEHLLTRHATAGLAASVTQLVRLAHGHHLPLRIDEMNITPCPFQASQLEPSVATALWSADIPFEMAAVGVDGVNFQTTAASTNDLFVFKHQRSGWQATVAPEYYGLLMFARAAPVGARLVPVHPVAPIPLRAWSTRAPDGTVRVLVVNNGRPAKSLAVRGVPGGAPGVLQTLRSTPTATGSAVTLGGQTFGPATATGVLAGHETAATVSPRGQRYVFRVPGRSAVLLTVP